MIKMRVSICGVKRTVKVPKGYVRVYSGPIQNGDLWYNAQGEFMKKIEAAEICPCKIEDVFECVFRKSVMPKVNKKSKKQFNINLAEKITVLIPKGYKLVELGENVFDVVKKT